MKFSTREQINAPIHEVFEALSDFDYFEELAREKGLSVERLSDNCSGPSCQAWHIGFLLWGKSRQVRMEVLRVSPPEEMIADFNSSNLTGTVSIELVRKSPETTRALVTLEFRPATLKARVLVQSLKLKKPGLTAKYKSRVAELATAIAARCPSNV